MKDVFNILRVVDEVSYEKSIGREEIFAILESVLAAVAARKYGNRASIKVVIDRKNAEIKVYSRYFVVGDGYNSVDVTDCGNNILQDDDANNLPIMGIEEARAKCYSLGLNAEDITDRSVFYDRVTNVHFDRIDVQLAKQLAISKIKKIEKAKERKEYEGKINEILLCTVEEVSAAGAKVKIGGSNSNIGYAFIRRKDMLRYDHFKRGDKIKACLVEIDLETKGPQLILSRTTDFFLIQLLALHISEIYTGVIKIKDVAREPGSRSKVVVYSLEAGISPVGSCLGPNASRIKMVKEDLGGEKVDIIQWNDKLENFITNAFNGMTLKISVDYEKATIDAVVSDADYSRAVGRDGQNVRLISKIVNKNFNNNHSINWKLSINSETEVAQRRDKEKKVIKLVMDSLDVDEVLARLLVSHKYATPLSIAEANPEDVRSATGLNEDSAVELKNRAIEYERNKHQNLGEDLDNLLNSASYDESDSSDKLDITTENRISSIKKNSDNSNEILMSTVLKALSIAGITTLRDLADLSIDELIEILEVKNLYIDREKLEALIMRARNIAYLC